MYISWSFVFLSLFTYILQSYSLQSKNKGQSLGQRVQQLVEMNHKKSILSFNGAKFKEFIKTAPRNYSVIVMFTALSSKRQCSICKHAHEEFTVVANSFRYSQIYSNKLFFVKVDFDEGSDVFQMMDINTAPLFIHFPPKGKPKNSDEFDFQRYGFMAEALAKWIGDRCDVQIRVFRPPNYSGTLALIMLFALVAGFLYVRRNNLDFLYNKNLWGIGAVFFCLAMLSGQMWNHIRGPPFFHRPQKGGSVSYIYGTSQGQFVLETYIIIILNGAVVLGMIMMTDAAARKGDVRTRQIFTLVGLAIVVIFFSIILSIFRSKASGYPYSFLFK